MEGKACSINNVFIAMNKIAICIPTFKRPDMLKNLVLSIVSNEFNKSLIKEVCIIIADNDVNMTAEPTVNALKKSCITGIDILYISYPVKGLSNVRNELLKRAFLSGADFLVFIDDDGICFYKMVNRAGRNYN